MNKIIFGFSLLLVGMTTTFANTDMSAKWLCTTNASSSDVAADKTADDQMAKEQGSVAKSFEFAAKNCRDCTKITCELQD